MTGICKTTKYFFPSDLILYQNKANLRDLIAATSLVILRKIGFKSSIFQSMWSSNLVDDIEKIRAPLLYYIKHCASFQTHGWIQTAVTVQKCSIWVKIGDFLPCMALKFGGWPWQTIGHLFYATSSFVNNFKTIGEFKQEWQSGNAQFRSKSAIFVPCDLEISWMTLKNNRAPLLCYFKIWASFHSHLWIRTGVTVRKIPILGQNWYLF